MKQPYHVYDEGRGGEGLLLLLYLFLAVILISVRTLL